MGPEPSALADPGRLEALKRTGLGQHPIPAFDRLARLARAYLNAPAAMVTLVEEDRQVFAGLAAADERFSAVRETPIAGSYAHHVVESRDVVVVNDAREDPVLCEHPALVELGVVAYLGVPIRSSDAHVIGCFCAMDTTPREWTPAQIAFLTDLAASVMTEIDLRQELAERARVEARRAASEAHYRRLATGIPQGVYVLDVEGRFTEVNSSAERILDRTSEELLGKPFGSVISPRNLPELNEVFRQMVAGEVDDIEFEAWITQPSGEERLLVITASTIEDDGRVTGLHGIARDITAEREVARALRRSEERFRLIAGNIRDIFWMFTPDFSKTLYMSPAFEELFGMPLDRAYGDPRVFLDVVHPDDVPILLSAMEVVAHEQVMGVEYRVVHPDGSVRWLRSRGYPARQESGAVTRVVGTTEDITERKNADLALRESERQLRLILDALPVGAVLAERPAKLVWHNAAADRIWGGVRPASPESSVYKGYWPDTGEPIASQDWPLARALRGEEVRGELTDIEAFDGTRRTTLNSAVPLRNAAGEITAALLVQEDVTEARARESQQRLLAAALEGLSEAIFLVTPDGEIVYGNDTFTRMFGVDPERIPGTRIADFARGEDDVEDQQAQLRIALEQGRWSGRVRRSRVSDGAEVTLDLVLGRVEQHGTSRLLLGIAQDATTEIQREQHLRRAERLASVGTMIGGVAHELNNPLQAILNFAQLMLLDERSEHDSEALEAMVRESQRMAKIVADLKQIARRTQEEDDPTSASDLNDVVHHVLKVQEYRLRTSNIEVRLDLAAELPPVRVDRGQLEQVLVNLVVNAEQAMSERPDGGRLVLRTRASARGASLHVIDNGHGIPPHQLERIFDPFFTTKAPGEGTGLGLSLVHSIVAEHGGEIRVDSEIGTGTAFRLDWLRAIEYQPALTGAAPDDGTRPLRVLVVDDEPSVRRVMARFLTRRGHTVDQAADGAAALEMVDAADYDVVLSDLRMPGLNGEALMDRLRERGLADTVVVMTGDAAGAASRLGEAGVPVLLKPVELADVARAVETRRKSTR